MSLRQFISALSSVELTDTYRHSLVQAVRQLFSYSVIPLFRYSVFRVLPTPYIYKKVKNIKNVRRCRDGMPKSMQTR